jgi:TetR/AcrR family transcriptional regulator, acrAB operon repressor
MARKPAHEQFDTHKAIHDQAFQLFGRHGYEGVSIGDIAQAARLSKAALYWHFSGKCELYLQCLGRLHGLFRQHIFMPMEATPDPLLALLHMFRGLERVLRDPLLEQGVAGYWLTPSSPEAAPMRQAQAAFESECQAAIERVLHRGVAARRLDLAGGLEDMAGAMIALMEAVVLPLRTKSAEDVHRMMTVLARTLFRAYATEAESSRLAALL